MSVLFWRAIFVCCAQALFHHNILRLSSSYVWLCMAVASLAPVFGTYKQPLTWNSRTIVDCIFDILGVALPAAATQLYPCAASLTSATLFRSLAIPLVALLKGNTAILPEAVYYCLMLTLVATLRTQQCSEEQGSAVAVSALLLSATLCTAVVSVRQEVEKTWPTTNVMRIPVIGALLWATGGYQVDKVPGFDFFVFCVLSLGASFSVIAYNASVNEDAYLKTRMLSVRRLISGIVGIVILDRFAPFAAWLATFVALVAFVTETGFLIFETHKIKRGAR